MLWEADPLSLIIPRRIPACPRPFSLISLALLVVTPFLRCPHPSRFQLPPQGGLLRSSPLSSGLISYFPLLARGSQSTCLVSVSLSLQHSLARWTPIVFRYSKRIFIAPNSTWDLSGAKSVNFLE